MIKPGAPARTGPRLSRRILAAWLPWWPVERLARHHPGVSVGPFITVGDSNGPLIVAAANPCAAQAGLAPGMSLADARAIVPGVTVCPADPAADALALERLARWADRFTPRVMPDGVDTLFLDITGCTRLFGGEKALTESLRAALEGFGLTVRLALADTPGAAWALAHYGAEDPAVVPAGAKPSEIKHALARLPVAALRLSADAADALGSFGLHRICTLSAIESAELIRRFGMEPVRRLQQALGQVDEPIRPLRPRPPREVRRAFAEPISTAADIRAAVDGLLDDLCPVLSRSGEGVRRLRLVCRRVDGDRQALTVGTSRPLRRRKSLMGLFAEKLEQIEPGFGIDEIVLASDVVETIDEVQTDWFGEAAGGYRMVEELAELLDRLGNRFGFSRIGRPMPHESWLPERAVRDCGHLAAPAPPSPAAGGWPQDRDRPLRILSPPEPVEAGDSATPLARFRIRGRSHQVIAARGPERLECEWWRENAPRRDYYIVEDEAGRRYWLFHEAPGDPASPPRWSLHGIFA